MDNYIKLYQETKIAEKSKAVEIIKQILLEHKSKKYSWIKTINFIHRHFKKISEENIVNSTKLKKLNTIFKDAKSNYENGYSLLAIPNELKNEFEIIQDLKITFKEYIEHLATESAFSRVESIFYQDDGIFQNMYIVGKFEGYKNLLKFEIRNFQRMASDFELYNEVYELAYPKGNTSSEEDCNKKKYKSNGLFNFQRRYVDSLKSKNTFDEIFGEYFHSNTKFEDYINIFFHDPKTHNSQIILDCDTKAFACLLYQIRENLCFNINVAKIDRAEVFLTKIKRKPIRGGNIASSLSKADEYHKDIAKEAVISFKEVNRKLKKGNM